MPSTHVSLHFHLVFSTKERRATINQTWRARLHAYIGGIMRALGVVAEEIGGTEDHVHILASFKGTHCLADVMNKLKSNSSRWVHQTIGYRLFCWQDGYGAFSVSRSQIHVIREYIGTQEVHHKHRTFQEEYIDLLRQNGIDFDERYLW